MGQKNVVLQAVLDQGQPEMGVSRWRSSYPLGRAFSQTWSSPGKAGQDGGVHLMFSGQMEALVRRSAAAPARVTKLLLPDFYRLKFTRATSAGPSTRRQVSWESLPPCHGTANRFNPRVVYPAPRLMAATWMAEEDTAWLFGGIGRQVDGPARTCDTLGTEDGRISALCDLMAYSVSAGRWELFGDCEAAAAADHLLPPSALRLLQNIEPRSMGLGLKAQATTHLMDNAWPTVAVQASAWTGSAGELWLFGGAELDHTFAGTFAGCGNDLWRFDNKTRKWTSPLQLAAAASWPGRQCGAQVRSPVLYAGVLGAGAASGGAGGAGDGGCGCCRSLLFSSLAESVV